MARMKAIVLVRTGDPGRAFELRDLPDAAPGPGEVLIDVEYSGINFADVLARVGRYREAPRLPSVLGYDVVGRVSALGPGADAALAGKRVVALTRFGGYASRAAVLAGGVVPIPEDADGAALTALGTQYVTAWYAAEELVRLRPGDRVLVHAAAGGVGTALVQIALHRGCVVFGTAGGPAKIEALRAAGVHHAIDYRAEAFDAAVRREVGATGLDVVFDSVGGGGFRKSFGLLGPGGRLVAFGVAGFAASGLAMIRTLLGFGIFHPAQLLTASRSILAVNLLEVARGRPEVVGHCLQAVAEGYREGFLRPRSGGVFKPEDIAAAHRALEGRTTQGKLAVRW